MLRGRTVFASLLSVAFGTFLLVSASLVELQLMLGARGWRWFVAVRSWSAARGWRSRRAPGSRVPCPETRKPEFQKGTTRAAPETRAGDSFGEGGQRSEVTRLIAVQH